MVRKGKYAPKTRSNNYFVFAGEERVLAHCFAHIRNPERYEGVVDAIAGAWEMFGSVDS